MQESDTRKTRRNETTPLNRRDACQAAGAPTCLGCSGRSPDRTVLAEKRATVDSPRPTLLPTLAHNLQPTMFCLVSCSQEAKTLRALFCCHQTPFGSQLDGETTLNTISSSSRMRSPCSMARRTRRTSSSCWLRPCPVYCHCDQLTPSTFRTCLSHSAIFSTKGDVTVCYPEVAEA